jgi:hypothetical protein
MNTKSSGTIYLSKFHDCGLSGVMLLPGGGCALYISGLDAKESIVTLTGVVCLRVDNFLEGNIILDVVVQSGPNVREADVLFALSINEKSKHGDFVGVTMDRIRRNELYLVQVNPSYGCTLACLCSEWSLTAAEGGYSGGQKSG